MAAKYIVRKRQNKILYTEFFFAALAAGILALKYFEVHPAIALSVGIASIFLFAFLFFANGIFRFLFTILFSLGWAFIAFFAGHLIEAKTDTTSWVFAILAFALSIWAHWDQFNFIKQARVYEYESH